MERISTKKLPPIFKMSVLCNILPYYGHLHRWRRLLEKINTETKEIWDQNREQLVYIGKEFKRDIELDSLKLNRSKLRPNRSWLDLFSLSISYDFKYYLVDFTNLINNLATDEVIIIIDSHDNIFKKYQINFWIKDNISDILPAIKCPSFKSETKIFKISEMKEFWKFIENQNHIKSIMIENVGEELSINLVYGDIIKIAPNTFCSYQQTKFFNKLKERYELWEIDDCSCKPKKIRVWADNFENLKHTIEELERISNTDDTKFGMHIDNKEYNKPFYDYDTMVFNNSARWKSEKTSKFIFTGDSLTVVSEGNSYDFKLDETTKKSTNSEIRGKIINYNSKNYFALNVDRIYDLNFILKDEEVKNPENKEFIDDLKECSKYTEDCLIIFDQKDITLWIKWKRKCQSKNFTPK